MADQVLPCVGGAPGSSLLSSLILPPFEHKAKTALSRTREGPVERGGMRAKQRSDRDLGTVHPLNYFIGEILITNSLNLQR